MRRSKNESSLGPGSPIQRAALAVFALAAVALGLSGAGIGRWYRIDHDTVLAQDRGLFRQCSAVGLSANVVCTSLAFDDISADCSRSGAEMLNRTRAVSATSIIGPMLLLISLALCIRRRCATWASWLSCVCATTCVLVMAFSVSWSTYLFQSWYYCGGDYCSWRRNLGSTEACSSDMGVSWYLTIAGLGVATVSLIIVIVRHIQRLREHNKGMKVDLAVPAEFSSIAAVIPQPREAPVGWLTERASSPLAKAPHQPTDNFPERPPAPQKWPDFSFMALSSDNVLPDGEWVFDPSCNLYWSNGEQLYVHLESGMFYDPHSQMWYNSETNEWVAGS